MRRVAGLDAHSTYVVVTIVSNEGERVAGPERIRNEEADELVALLARHAPLEVVVEASGSWPWIYDRLESQDVRVVLAHPKKLRAIAESKYKTDAIDAALLARMRLVDLISEVYPKPIEQRELATLVRHRARLVRQRTGTSGRIHAELHALGLSLRRGELLTRVGRRWVHSEAWPLFGPEQQSLVETHERLIDLLTAMIKELDRRIARIGAEMPAVQLLETIPGIGAYRALLIVSETDPIARFEQPKHLVSYAGLAPVSSRSGKSVRYGSIPAGANRWLRNAFVQAALSHCRFAPESRLTRYYEDQKQRVGWRVARIATARKFARVVHAMLRTGEVWSPV